MSKISNNKEVCKTNLNLLSNEKLIVKVYKTTTALLDAYANRFVGKLSNNGYVYIECKKAKTSLTYNKFYPTKMRGKIDCYGNVELITKDKKAAFFGGYIPIEYSGKIDENGFISLSITKKEWEPTGNEFIYKMIFDPFKGNVSNRNKFLSNIRLLKRLNE